MIDDRTHVAVSSPEKWSGQGWCKRCGKKLKHGWQVNGSLYGPVCVYKVFPTARFSQSQPAIQNIGPHGARKSKLAQEIINIFQPNIFEERNDELFGADGEAGSGPTSN